MKKQILGLLLTTYAFIAPAQEKVYQIDEISVINYGDGRLLFRQIDEEKTPLQGEHRLIDGYRSEYIIADFKEGMYNGKYRHYKNNKLKEEGSFIEGRKNGVYKEYYSDGIKVKKEIPYTAGKLDGIVVSYYTNGKPETEKEYKMSIEDGIDREYDYESGKITTDMHYKDGKLHGNQVQYITSNVGEYVIRSQYDMGKLIGKYSETFSDGTIYKKGSYDKNGKKDGEWLIRNSFSDKDKFSGKRIIYKNGEIVKEEDIKNFEKYMKKN